MICMILSVCILFIALIVLLVLEVTNRHGNHDNIMDWVACISLILAIILVITGIIDIILSKEVPSEHKYKATIIYVSRSSNEIDLTYTDDDGQEQKETIECDTYTTESLNKNDTVWLSETHKVSFLFKTEYNSKYEIRPYVAEDE